TGTENILMAAVRAKGTTIIQNAARDPEIGTLIDMLVAMGARIKGRDTDRLEVHGVPDLRAADATIIPDRIETGTYLLAVGAAGGAITVKNCIPDHLLSLLDKLRATGMEIEEGRGFIHAPRSSTIKSIDVKTLPYPGFPTDLQASASLVVAGIAAEGRTEILWVYHLDRGYEKLVEKMTALGAKIWREKE
ncbi:MAG: UDP-N-acetylglucosamine 1-carboxyvinyltransferase, partial [Deltaproteobacteria bacterium]